MFLLSIQLVSQIFLLSDSEYCWKTAHCSEAIIQSINLWCKKIGKCCYKYLLFSPESYICT